MGADAIVANVFMRLGTEWDGYKAEPELVISDGDQVAARGWYSGTNKQTGKPFRARFVHWYTVTNGKIARFEQVVDSSKVNECLQLVRKRLTGQSSNVSSNAHAGRVTCTRAGLSGSSLSLQAGHEGPIPFARSNRKMRVLPVRPGYRA